MRSCKRESWNNSLKNLFMSYADMAMTHKAVLRKSKS